MKNLHSGDIVMYKGESVEIIAFTPISDDIDYVLIKLNGLRRRDNDIFTSLTLSQTFRLFRESLYPKHSDEPNYKEYNSISRVQNDYTHKKANYKIVHLSDIREEITQSVTNKLIQMKNIHNNRILGILKSLEENKKQ